MRKSMKKTAVMLMAVFMVITFMPGVAVKAFAENGNISKNAEGYYEINDAKDMLAFAQKVAADNKADNNAKLMKDIDMSEIDVANWTPIGFENFDYKGVFDGNGKEIKNFNAVFTHDLTSSKFTNVGLFGVISAGGTVKNIKNMTGNMVSSAQTGSGSIAGNCVGTIENCVSNLSIEFKNGDQKQKKIGGIVGDVNSGGNINRCGFGGEIKAAADNFAAGGICGNHSGGKLNSCYNHGSIAGAATGTKSDAARLGGIIGNGPGYNSTVKYCYNTGKITATGDKSDAGGIVGYSNVKSTLGNSYNTGEVSGNSGKLGTAIVGGGHATRRVEIKDSVFHTLTAYEGKVTSEFLNSADTVNNKLNDKEDGMDAGLKFTVGQNLPKLKWEGGGEPPVTPEEVPVDSVKITVVKDGVLKAEVKGKDGKAATNVTYQWQRCSDEFWDDIDQETKIEFEDLAGETSDTLKITAEKKSRFNKYKVIVKGDKNSRKEADVEHDKVMQEGGSATEDEKVLNAVVEKFSGTSPLRPKFGKDTNLKAFMKDQLEAANFAGVSVESVDKVEKSLLPNGGSEANIASDGALTYFYYEPTKVWEDPVFNLPWARFTVTLTIKKGEATKKLILKNVDLHWNAEKLAKTLNDQILTKVDFDAIKGGNGAQDSVISDLSLVRYFGGKDSTHKNTEIVWKSSDEKAIKVNTPEGDTDTVAYAPMIGKVIRGREAKTVTLTATINYKKAESKEAEEAVGKLKKEFKITIKGYEPEEANNKELQEKLEKGLQKKGLRDFCTGEPLDPTNVRGSIQFPTTRDFGVDGKFQPVTVGSDNKDVAEPWYNKDGELLNNAASMKIYRPLPGKNQVDVKLTIKITDKRNGAEASKDINVTVKPLEQQELDKAKELMEKAVAGYYDGIKNRNTDKDDIKSNLRAFQEVNFGEGEALSYVYSYENRKWSGIGLDTRKENAGEGGVEAPGYSDLDYSRFYSSNPELIQHDNLILTGKKPDADTKVTIESYLTHQVYGKYYTKYKSKGDAAAMAMFAPLYRQHASATVTVKCDQNLKAAKAVEDKINKLPEEDALTLEDEEKVNEAKTAYDALTEEQKKLVSDGAKEKLEKAVAKIKQMKENEVKDKEAAKAVEDKIGELPDPEEATIDIEEKVNDAKAAYDALTEKQKKLVSAEAKDKLDKAALKIWEHKYAVEQLENQIRGLPELENLSADDANRVHDVGVLYESFYPAQKALVKKELVDRLRALQEKMVGLKAAKDAAEELDLEIENTWNPEQVKYEDIDFVVDLIKRYDALTDEQKVYIFDDNKDKIEALRERVKELKEEKEAEEKRKEKAAAVEKLLNALPTVTDIKLSDEVAVKEARKAYEELSNMEKKLVSQDALALLEAAEREIADLKEEEAKKAQKAKADSEAAAAVEKLIDALSPASAIKLEDEAKVKEARAAYGKLTQKQKNLLKAGLEKKLADCEKAIAELKKAKDGVEKLKDTEAKVKKAVTTKLTLKGLKLKPVKGHKIKLSWKSGGNPDGYQVAYKKAKAKKYSKVKTVKKLKYASKKLRKGTKYVFKLRAYKKIDGKKVYSKWYKSKKVTCK